ncbi:MAG: hypothetical protein GTN43_02165 [Candidatus Aenigmarchaeota archaeon]|nr:hypothetical protein [Candidatus Aenigmarchaeota archaeon]
MKIVDRVKAGETVDIGNGEKIWVCKKCYLIRSNAETHRHGVPLSFGKLEQINNLDKKEEAEKHGSEGTQTEA